VTAAHFPIAPAAGEKATVSFANDVAHDAVIAAEGSVSITPSGANTTTTQTIVFGKTFPAAPNLSLQILTGVAANVGCVVWPSNVGLSGCDVNVNRGNTTLTQINWIAVLNQ
jgi:hypothetical protein